MTFSSPTEWVLRPRPPGDRREDDLSGFRLRLSAALRAGHGSGSGFRISVDSGAAPTLTLAGLGTGSARWLTRVLLPSYERHQWGPTRTGETLNVGSDLWTGTRVRPWPAPVRVATDGTSAFDSVSLALSSLSTGARLEWTFRPAPLVTPPWWEVAAPALNAPDRRFGARGTSATPRTVATTEPIDRSPLWRAVVHLKCTRRPADGAFATRVARTLDSASRSVGGNGLRFRPRRWWGSRTGPEFPMSETEVVLTLPTPSCPASGGSAPPRRTSVDLLPLGRTFAGTVVGPALEPGQGRHLAVLGETGMGKSSLLVTLSRRAAGHGGLILFDPLGETARAVREELPASTRDRLTWIEPGAAVDVNALNGVGPSSGTEAARQERQLNDLVHALRRVRAGRYADSGFWGPRLEEMLTRALHTAAAFPGGTLVDAHTLLASGARGFRAIPPEAIEAVAELADRIRARPEDADGARRLLYELTRSPVLVRMLCARRPTIGVRELVAPGRIVLIAGNAASVGESTARYLLSTYLALTWSELLARGDRGKTFVVVDEAQWFVHESLAEMLRLGRRQNVHVVLATQAVASLPETVAEAVWTNVADFVAFRGSLDEAREFSAIARNLPPESILSLPRGEAAILLGKGGAVHWARTARAPAPRSESSPVDRGPERSDAVAPTPRPTPPGITTESGPAEATPRSGDVDEVLTEVARQVGARETPEPVRISLTALRERFDPGGRAVREAGGILGRSGALVRTGRDDVGPCWWIDPVRFDAANRVPVPGETLRDTRPPQP